MQLLEKEFKQLSQHIVLTLTAEDGKNYVKFALHHQLKHSLTYPSSKYMVLHHKFNTENIDQAIEQQGCKFLCICTASPTSNSREYIETETEQGRIETEPKDNVVSRLMQVPCQGLFICMPKQGQLAELLTFRNHSHNNKKVIISFDFHHEAFKYCLKGDRAHEYLLCF